VVEESLPIWLGAVPWGDYSFRPPDLVEPDLDRLSADDEPVSGRLGFTFVPVDCFTVNDGLIASGAPFAHCFARSRRNESAGRRTVAFNDDPDVAAASAPCTQRLAQFGIESQESADIEIAIEIDCCQIVSQ